MKTQFLLFFVAAACILTLNGCAGGSKGQTFVREGVDIGYVNKVAVLPFANNTDDDFAAQRIRNITATEILAMELFDVVDQGIVDSALREMAINRDTPLDEPLIRRLGQRLGVQGFIIGEVNGLGENRQAAFVYTEVSLTLQLLDSESAQALWRNSDSLSGYSLTDRLFGLAPMDSFQVTVSLLKRMLSTIPK